MPNTQCPPLTPQQERNSRVYQFAGIFASPLGPIACGMFARYVLEIPHPSTEFAMWMWGPFIFGWGMVFGVGLTETREK